MKLKQLETLLTSVDGFTSPKVLLEQYETPCHIASHMLFQAQAEYGDLAGKTVADLGCGCGMLSVGAAVMGASTVTG